MEKSQIRSVALFYFFTLLDKNLVYKATADTIKFCKREQSRHDKKIINNSFLVKATYKFWQKYKNQKSRPLIELQEIKESFHIPAKVNFSVWKQFMKDSQTNISLVVVWACLLGFTEKEISEGMEVSHGTVRYRTGKGLKDLAVELGIGVGNA
jgi:hypothetical protein